MFPVFNQVGSRCMWDPGEICCFELFFFTFVNEQNAPKVSHGFFFSLNLILLRAVSENTRSSLLVSRLITCFSFSHLCFSFIIYLHQKSIYCHSIVYRNINTMYFTSYLHKFDYRLLYLKIVPILCCCMCRMVYLIISGGICLFL